MKAILLLALLTLAACGHYQPSCQDNPRNMGCMSAGQLEQELAING